jgi:hypothetical protein
MDPPLLTVHPLFFLLDLRRAERRGRMLNRPAAPEGLRAVVWCAAGCRRPTTHLVRRCSWPARSVRSAFTNSRSTLPICQLSGRTSLATKKDTASKGTRGKAGILRHASFTSGSLFMLARIKKGLPLSQSAAWRRPGLAVCWHNADTTDTVVFRTSRWSNCLRPPRRTLAFASTAA